MRTLSDRLFHCTSCVALVAGCGFTTFNDYESQAPVVKIEQEGSRSSSAFGVHLAAMQRRQIGNPLPGGALVVSGNNDVALNTVTFGVDGKFANSEAEGDDFLKFLGDPDQITALASAPSDRPTRSHGGPFVYVGKARKDVGSLMIVDINSYDGPGDLSAPSNDVQSFACAVAPASLAGGDERRDDLVVGAKGAVVLWRATSWPVYTGSAAALVVESGGVDDWPADQRFTALAAGRLQVGEDSNCNGALDAGEDADGDGELDEGGDAIAVAAPGGNFVAVLHGLEDVGTERCVDTCAKVLKLELPAGAQSFGRALLVANVIGNACPELVVGAPDSAGGGAVFVYQLKSEHFDGAEAPPTPIQIQTPSGAASFGAALTSGNFDGSGQLLAVGAPGSEVDGKKTAGAIYLYRADLDEPVSTIRLARPAANGLLGDVLTSMPFQGADRVHDVLVASGATAAYVFFANTTPNHEDIRP